MSRGDRGSITPLVPIVILAFLLLGGLVIDGSRELNARSDAQAYAEEAARAGAGAVDLHSNELALDPNRVRSNVAKYCKAVRQQNQGEKQNRVTSCHLDTSKGVDGLTATTTCGGKSADIVVNTVVTTRINTSLLGIVGFTALTSTAHARARPYQGITAASAC
jgi:Flp pilus assembly protein TadG